jgi:hypothetical protein
MQPSGSGAKPKSVAGHNGDLALMIQTPSTSRLRVFATNVVFE